MKALIDNVEGLSAEMQAEYEQISDTKDPNNGKFRLKVEPVGGLVLENVTGLKNTVQTLRGEKEALTSKLKAFDGLDPEASRTAIQKVTEWGDMTPEQKAQQLLKSKEDQLASKYKAQEELILKDRDAALGQLDQNIRVAAITSAIAGKKPVDGAIDMLMPHALRMTKTKKTDNGKYVAVVVDDDGNERINPSGGGTDLMTITQLADELETKFPFAFAGSGSSGSGATGGGTPSKPSAGGSVRTISRTDQEGMNRNLEGIAKGTVKVVN